MKKILLSSVALLSLVTTLPVNSPVSAQESISPKSYSHFQSNGCWWYKHSNGSYTRNGWKTSMKPSTILIVRVG